MKVLGLVLVLLFILSIFSGGAFAKQNFEDSRNYGQAFETKGSNEAKKLLFFDNFSVDSKMWTYVGNAYLDPVNGYVVLTKDINHQVGIIWLNRSITTSFTIEFKYKAGGGSGADGITFMFYKQTGYEPADGGNLGFIGPNGSKVPGYAIEFDNHQHPQHNDPSSNHIALIKDDVNNHLIYVNDSRTEDNLWHDVQIVVNASEVRVAVDKSSLFKWSKTCNTTYGGFGFGGATGGLNNWHIIDDVNITVELPAYLDTGYGSYPSIAGIHNGTITPSYDINVTRLYTYLCPGTGGHAEYVAIAYPNGTVLGVAHWNGYINDWANLTFNNSFTLYANETYNYTIRTGSYPQIIHAPSWTATGGVITCTEFIDINGKRHEGWIPAIRLS